MARITLEDVQIECKKHKWQCLSTEYTNLKTLMQFKCDEGHTVETTWEKLRDKFICPTCKVNVKKQIVNVSGKPKTKEYRILALDQSSHKTGYAVYDGLNLVAYGVYETFKNNPLDRIADVCDWVDSMIAQWKPDEVGMEETQYQPGNGDGHNVFKLLSQVMGAIMITCIREKCKVRTVLIPTWRHHCGVKGNRRADQKLSAQRLVKDWHDISVTDDESDAICIGKYFADTHGRNCIGEFD